MVFYDFQSSGFFLMFDPILKIDFLLNVVSGGPMTEHTFFWTNLSLWIEYGWKDIFYF